MSEVDLKSAPTFSPKELEQITEAIVESFDLGELTRALRFKWGLVLANFVNTQQGFCGTVDELVAWTERRKKTVELVALAYAERPDHTTLRQLAEAHDLSLPAVEQKYDLSRPLPPKPTSLEAMVARHSRFVDYSRFLSRFMALGDRVCRIETPYKLGTGFLVAADLVLTNFHVVEEVIHTPSQAGQVVCSFDYRLGSDYEESAPQKKPLPAGVAMASRKTPVLQDRYRRAGRSRCPGARLRHSSIGQTHRQGARHESRGARVV